MDRKALVIDSCGINPILFALDKKYLSINEMEKYFDKGGIDLYHTESSKLELNFNYSNQQPLFVEPITVSSSQSKNIFLSDSGIFSQSSFGIYSIESQTFDLKISSIRNSDQSTLWQNSTNWEHLSEEDKGLINTAENLSRDYKEVAILTNDWHLRQQCLNYEGVNVCGTCSLLAGMVILGDINYQKGTYVYGQWLQKNPRWIPNSYNDQKVKRKLTFKEVLKIEKGRVKNNKSFWV